MPNTITSSSNDYTSGLDYTPIEGEEAICENPETPVSGADACDYECLADDDGDRRGVDALVGNAQQGQLYDSAQAGGGYEGGSSVGPEAIELTPSSSPGGTVYSLDGSVGAALATVGVQGAVVWDDECGPGLVGSVAEGVQAPGVGANLTLGISEYEGSFRRFNDSFQVAAGGGAVVYGEGKVFLDSETGEPIGGGIAAGVGTPGVGASVTQSQSVVYFPACPQY